MTRDEITERFETFFEWDTDDRSIVTSTSAKLFAECISDLTASNDRERIAAWVEDMCAGLDAKTIANGKTCWVRACKVGDASKGVVFKDYEVKT